MRRCPHYAGIGSSSCFEERRAGFLDHARREANRKCYFFFAAFFLAFAFAFFLALAMMYLQLRVSPRASIYTRM